MIRKEIRENRTDFLILGTILAVGVFSFLFSDHNLFLQKLSVIFTGFGYFFWGMFHHLRKKDLCAEVLLEYFFLAVLGTLFVLFVLLRS